MKKTSVYLEPELDRAVAELAQRSGISKAEAIRQALREAVRDVPARRITAIGVFDGPRDLAERVDDHLTDSGFGE